MIHSVYLVNSNELFCEGLKRILIDKPFEINGMVDRLQDLPPRSDEFRDGSIILIDASGEEARKLDGLLETKERFPTARFVILASKCDKHQFARYVAAGVDGYLIKTISADVLAGALHLIALGEKVFPSIYAVWLLESVQPGTGEAPAGELWHDDLSKRELDILACLAEGQSNKMIARRLHISDATVKVHVKSVLKKLNASNRTQAAVWALKYGLVNKDLVADHEAALTH